MKALKKLFWYSGVLLGLLLTFIVGRHWDSIPGSIQLTDKEYFTNHTPKRNRLQREKDRETPDLLKSSMESPRDVLPPERNSFKHKSSSKRAAELDATSSQESLTRNAERNHAFMTSLPVPSPPIKQHSRFAPPQDDVGLLAINDSRNVFFYPERLSQGTNVIINANYRTGSSFTGELFNQHREFMYMFEPLRSFEKWMERPLADSVVDMVLGRLLICNMTNVDMLKGGWNFWILCGIGKYCNNQVVVKKRRRFWDGNYPTMCTSKRHHAIKTIRVETLRHLVPLMRRGVKVIQLVRDPRATIVSRGRTANSTSLQSIKNYCDKRLADLAFIKDLYQIHKATLSEAVYYLRYEDLATSPVPTMTDVYNFIGIKPDDNVNAWAANVAKNNFDADKEVGNGSMKPKGRYSTSRSNPAYTAQTWRHAISMDALEYTQGVCGDFLRVFGYTVFKNKFDLENFTISAIKEMPF